MSQSHPPKQLGATPKRPHQKSQKGPRYKRGQGLPGGPHPPRRTLPTQEVRQGRGLEVWPPSHALGLGH